MVSEIVGVGAVLGQRTGSRIDPLGIRKEIQIFEDPKTGTWTLDRPAGKSKPKKPSEINHGNIAPSVQPLGVTIDYALLTTVISLAGLRRLSFPAAAQPAPTGADDRAAERDQWARTALAALALVAVTEQERAGYALRSRCDLVPDPEAPPEQSGRLELVRADGSCEPLEITAESALELLRQAIQRCRQLGLDWREEPLRLVPQPRLIELVQRSRELALAGQPPEED
ncbi:MAG: hypothetical protein KatS3mg102_2009 [Planctomycetota bacterium]|nr:MAG: hypothetical protein KatS3mg102_2009 [Planctomycetota bacterium]